MKEELKNVKKAEMHSRSQLVRGIQIEKILLEVKEKQRKYWQKEKNG